MNPAQVFAALHAPIAPYTWSVQATLPRDEASTARVPVDWQRPLEIVAFIPSVVPVEPRQGGGNFVPGPDDIEVMIDINQERRLTNRLQQATVAGPGESFVPLSMLDVFTPRLIREQIANAAPDLGFEFRWRQNDPAAPTFEGADIHLGLLARYLTREEIQDIRAAPQRRV